MEKIKLVKQKHKHACSIACVSMVTGESYDNLIKEFGNNFHKAGIDDEILVDFISFKGYAILEKSVTRFNRKDIARKEMIRPFAPIHIVKIKLNADSGLYHWVVMDKKGRFYCPMEWKEEAIKDSYRIVKVIGIYNESKGDLQN